MLYKYIRLYKLLFTLIICSETTAQISTDTLIRMKDAVQLAEEHYHLLKARKYEADAAEKNIDVVKYSRLPTIDASYQANIATANNLTGMFYPNGILPISGPPSANNNYSPATGSAASILLNWQASTFGQRNAQINLSITESNSKKLEWQQDIFKYKVNVISAYLDVLLGYDFVSIHRQNIQRV